MSLATSQVDRYSRGRARGSVAGAGTRGRPGRVVRGENLECATYT